MEVTAFDLTLIKRIWDMVLNSDQKNYVNEVEVRSGYFISAFYLSVSHIFIPLTQEYR